MSLLFRQTLIESLKAYPILWVGFSGGMDSVVLLHGLNQIPEIKNKIHAIHVHHGLSPNADAWSLFCEKLCDSWHIPLKIKTVSVTSLSNIEGIARNLRYQAFSETIDENEALLLAHHLDDQIETFFLHALRGSGIDGLSAMPLVYQRDKICIIRPLLDLSRQSIAQYAKQNQLTWVEDESNLDTKFSRNFLRQEVLPLIEKKWPHYRKNLQHTITACQEVSEYLNVDRAVEHLEVSSLKNQTSLERQILIRQWFQRYGLKLPPRKLIQQIEEQMISPKRLDTNAKIQWGGVSVYCYQNQLYMLKDEKKFTNAFWLDFPNTFRNIQAIETVPGVCIQKNDVIEVRYREGGEIFFWKGHHHSLKKLFQAWQIPPFLRKSIPLIYVNGILKAVVGFATVHEDLGLHKNHKSFCFGNISCNRDSGDVS